jgi:hypothetical protein
MARAKDDKLEQFQSFLEGLSPEERDVIPILFRVSAFSIGNIGIANRNILLNRLVCSSPGQSGFGEVDISGTAQTGANGRFEWKLSDFLCESQLIDAAGRTLVIDDVNFLATPISTTVSPTARLLTTTRGLISNNGRQVTVTVFTWQPGGQAAGSVSFAWRCRLIGQRLFVVP